MKFENTEVFNFQGAIRGMRNPKNSWDRSDSWFDPDNPRRFELGKADLKLMQTLINAGSEHRKFMRQIFICVDIVAPAYIMAEIDTYKTGITRNSCSFQHKGTAKPFELSDFEIDFEIDEKHQEKIIWDDILYDLNEYRDLYLETKNYNFFRAIRQMLPQSYLYRATFTMNYENIYNIYHQRKNHPLKEWSEDFVRWVETLPYAEELIIGIDKKGA